MLTVGSHVIVTNWTPPVRGRVLQVSTWGRVKHIKSWARCYLVRSRAWRYGPHWIGTDFVKGA